MITLLRSLIAKATPGLWGQYRNGLSIGDRKAQGIAEVWEGHGNEGQDNAAYICAANPDNIAKLIDLIDTCEKAFEVLVRNGISDDIAVEALQRIREMKE
jgi:hypothetical protein